MSQPMSAEEYRRLLTVVGYTQEGFAVLVGASKRTGQKWALGESRVPGSVALLLRLFEARPELLAVAKAMTPPAVRGRATAKPRKPRGKKDK